MRDPKDFVERSEVPAAPEEARTLLESLRSTGASEPTIKAAEVAVQREEAAAGA